MSHDPNMSFFLSLVQGSAQIQTALSAPNTITLSVTSIDENVAPGSVVAIISANGNPPPTLSLTTDTDSKFEIVGNELRVRAGAVLDAEAPDVPHEVVITASNSEGTFPENFIIAVNDLPSAVNLQGFAFTIDTPLAEGYSSIPVTATGGPVLDEEGQAITPTVEYSTDGTTWATGLPTVAAGSPVHVRQVFTSGTVTQPVVAGNSPLTVAANVNLNGYSFNIDPVAFGDAAVNLTPTGGPVTDAAGSAITAVTEYSGDGIAWDTFATIAGPDIPLHVRQSFTSNGTTEIVAGTNSPITVSGIEAIGAQGNLVFTQNTAITPIDVGALFDGEEDIVLIPAVPGLSIVSGTLSGTPTTAQANTPTILRGTDTTSGNIADVAFNLEVQASTNIVDIPWKGATFRVQDPVSTGTHANGSPWFETDANTRIIEVLPASAQLDHTYETSSSDPTPIIENHWAHGMHFRPGRAPTQGTLAQMQADNAFGPGAGGGAATAPNVTRQGYGWKSPNKNNFVDYDHTMNVDPGATGAAIVPQPGTYTKAISFLTAADLSWDGRPSLDRLAEITCYAQGQAPVNNVSFRPAFASDGTRLTDGPADLDMSLYQNLPIAAYTGPVISFAEADAILRQITTEEYTFSVNAENVQPADGVSFLRDGYRIGSYQGDISKVEGDIWLMMHTDLYTAAEKRTLAGLLAQRDIDRAGRAEQGGMWVANGGWCGGRKFGIARTAEARNNAGMRAAAGLTGNISYDGYTGGESVYGEDMQTDYITAADVAASAFTYNNSGTTQTGPAVQGGRSVALDASQVGWPTWIENSAPPTDGAALSTRSSQVYNTLGNVATLNTFAAGYENIFFKMASPMALASRMMTGVRATMGALSNALFDAADRFAEAWIDGTLAAPGVFYTDTTPVYQSTGINGISQFTAWFWGAQRANFGTVWTPPVTTPTTITIANQALKVYDSDPLGTQTALVMASGTHDGAAGAALQIRLVNDVTDAEVQPWTDFSAASGGQWTAMMAVSRGRTRLRYEVRARDATTVNAAQTDYWFSGIRTKWSGQSLIERPLLSTDSQALALTPPAEALFVTLNGSNGGVSETEVTAASTLGQRRAACVAGAYADCPVAIDDGTQSGTSRRGYADDADTDRSAANSGADVTQFVKDGGSAHFLILEHWITNDATTGDTVEEFKRSWSPFYSKKQFNGIAAAADASGYQNYVDGSTISVQTNNYVADNSMFDTRTAYDAGTTNLPDAARTKLAFFYGAAHRVSIDVADGASATGDRDKGEIRDTMRLIASDSDWAEFLIAGAAGYNRDIAFGSHLAQPGGTHVASGVDGESLVAAYLMFATLRAAGMITDREPQLNTTPTGGQGYVEFDIDNIPAGYTLSTPAAANAAGYYDGSFEGDNFIAATANVGDKAEFKDVMGFGFNFGAGNTWQGFTTSIEAGNKIRASSASLANGQTGNFGHHAGETISLFADIAAFLPQHHMPVLLPPVHVSGTGLGIPVVKRPNDAALFTVTGVTQAPAGPSGGIVFPADAWLRDPVNVPAGTSRITWHDVSWNFGGTAPANSTRLITQESTGNTIQVLNQTGVLSLRVTVEDNSGAKLLNAVEVYAGADPNDIFTWDAAQELSIDLFDTNWAAGTCDITINGVAMTQLTFTAGSTAQSSREVSLGATTTGNSQVPAGSILRSARVDFNGVEHIDFSGGTGELVAATINAGTYKHGTDPFTDAP